MKETGMVPVFYHADVETAKAVLKACYEGGVRAFEFTNRGEFAHEVFAELAKWVAKECPDMILGADKVCGGFLAFASIFYNNEKIKEKVSS